MNEDNDSVIWAPNICFGASPPTSNSETSRKIKICMILEVGLSH